MRSHRSLRTILFTDLVGSTARAAELGDTAWRELLQRHHAVVRQTLRRWGAREMREAGDGFLAILDSPARGIACAAEIREAVESLGFEVRCGVHMGEIEHTPDGSVSGIGVHIAARVMALAEPGEILVSRAIRDAEEGSGFAFEDRGTFELKGIPGARSLYRVTVLPENARSLAPGRGERVAAAVYGRTGRIAAAGAILVVLAAVLTLRGSMREDASPIVDTNQIRHTQITFLGNARKGAVSPDGKTVAYVAHSPNEADRLFIQDLVGGDPIEILRDDEIVNLRWSPAGQALLVGACKETACRMVLIPRLGGSTREFPFAQSALWFAWSSDGRAFAFAHYWSKFVFIQDLSSARVDSIALPGPFDVFLDLDWSPSGGEIAYVVKREPSRHELWTIDLSGKDPRRVVRDTVSLSNPRWSREGRTIYYLRDAGPNSKDLYKVEARPVTAGTESTPRAVMNLGRSLWSLSFELFGNGDGLSYVGYHGYSNLSLLTLQASGDHEVTQLTTGTADKSDPAVSPDGEFVAFTLTAGDRQNIHVVPTSGGSSRQLTFLEGSACCPAWSPDGREIAFFSSSGGEPRIWKVPVQGGSPAPFRIDLHMSRPETVQWAPGSQILYAGGTTSRIHLLDPRTGEEELVLSETKVCGWSARFSPDGRKIVCLGDRHLRVISLVTEEQSFVPRSSGWDDFVLGWSPDGDGIYTYHYASSRILRYALSGSAPSVMGEGNCGFVASMAFDAKRFICVSQELLLDLWVVRDFDPDRAVEPVRPTTQGWIPSRILNKMGRSGI